MVCPYRNFEDCLVEKCPSCEYEEVETEKLVGRYRDSIALGLARGTCWYEKQKKYEFKSCKLVENNVQPVPRTVISSEMTVKPQTNVTVVKRGIF